MTREDAIIQEYNSLRSEILAQFDPRSSRLAIVWAGVSALIVAGAIARIPEFACIALLIVSSGWIDEQRWFNNMIRIGSYIRIVLEPQVEGLQWESMMHSVNSGFKHRPVRQFRSLLLSTYGLFGIACIFSAIVFSLQFHPINALRQTVFYSLFSISVISWVITYARAIGLPKKSQNWEKLFKGKLEEYTSRT